MTDHTGEHLLARYLVRDIIVAGLTGNTVGLAHALRDMVNATDHVAFLVCEGLADTALLTNAGPGTYVLKPPDGLAIDDYATSSPTAAGHVLAARFITACGNHDSASALALFTAADPVDASIDETIRVGTFFHVLAQTAADAARCIDQQMKAALS